MAENQIKHLTTCLVCGQVFQNWQMDIPIIGEPPSARVAQFVATLANHVQKKHGDKMKAIQIGSQQYAGMLIMLLFRTQDPNLAETVDQARRVVAAVSRRPVISDAMILDRVVALSLDRKDQDKVVALMRDLRDYSCEMGAHAGNGQAITA